MKSDLQRRKSIPKNDGDDSDENCIKNRHGPRTIFNFSCMCLFLCVFVFIELTIRSPTAWQKGGKN